MKVAVIDGQQTTATFTDLDDALTWVDQHGQPDAVVHRVVHGADRTGPVILDDAEVDLLAELDEFAPLHQPPSLAAIARTRKALPEVAQWACFDTSFHQTIPAPARTYALPDRLRKRVRRYGFHGMSHAYASRRMTELAPQANRVLVAHLGGGQSLCGVKDGASLSTTMGFTPSDGLVMSTRSGTVDGSAIAWLGANSTEDLARVLESESGLVGLCGEKDLRVIIDRAGQGDAAAAFALAVYRQRLIECAGATVAAIGGLDAIVFTGGIGENMPAIRSMLVDGLEWLGARITPGPEAGAQEITADGSGVRTFIVHAREDLQMVNDVRMQADHTFHPPPPSR